MSELMSVDYFGGRLSAIVRHNMVLLSRDPGQIFGYTVMPLLLMIALRPIYVARSDPVSGTTQATIGPMVLFSLITLNVIGHNLLHERTWHTWDRLRASPATGAELLLGKSIPFYVMLLVQQSIVVLCGVLTFGLRVPGQAAIMATVLMMLVWSATILALGSLLATAVRSHGQLNTITDIGAFLVTVIGGGLTPPSAMPQWMHAIAPYSPGYWAISGYRAALTGQAGGALLRSIAVLLLIAVAAAALATWLTGRRTGARGQP